MGQLWSDINNKLITSEVSFCATLVRKGTIMQNVRDNSWGVLKEDMFFIDGTDDKVWKMDTEHDVLIDKQTCRSKNDIFDPEASYILYRQGNAVMVSYNTRGQGIPIQCKGIFNPPLSVPIGFPKGTTSDNQSIEIMIQK